LIASYSLDDTADFSLMVRPDRCSIDNIDSKASTINTIRFAFYLEDFDQVPAYFNHARSLGYKCFLNPVAISTNTHEEISSLLDSCAKLNPDGISIVDTFGALRPESFKDLVQIFNSKIPNTSYMGIHLHENLSLSFGMISDFLAENFDKRDIIIDSSLLGMGRIPGNTPTELVADLMNGYYGGSYSIQNIMLAISNVIYAEKSKRDWGYFPEYMISGSFNIHRSYAEHFVEHNGLDLKTSYILMKKVSLENKGSKFDESYANQLIDDL
jgi:4-hydroxy 2-oxovalerate aldolase